MRPLQHAGTPYARESRGDAPICLQVGQDRFYADVREPWGERLNLPRADVPSDGYVISFEGRRPNWGPPRFESFGDTARWVGAQSSGTMGPDGAHFHLATPEVGPNRISPRMAVQEAVYAVAHWRTVRRGGLVLHAATVDTPQGVAVVMGDSGAGKSTLSRRLADHYLHEEHAFLVPDASGNGGWINLRARSTWYGTDAPHPWTAAVSRLFWLGADRSVTGSVPLSAERALERVYHSVISTSGVPHAALFAAAVQLSRAVPTAELSHALGDSIDRLQATLNGSLHVD